MFDANSLFIRMDRSFVIILLMDTTTTSIITREASTHIPTHNSPGVGDRITNTCLMWESVNE